MTCEFGNVQLWIDHNKVQEVMLSVARNIIVLYKTKQSLSV